MAAPTITRVLPTTGRTLGRYIVRLDGSDFRLPTPPAPTGRAPVAPPSVRVRLVAGSKSTTALRVDVLSTKQLEVLMPACDAGEHDVVVENLDDTGAVISGESVTSVGGFTFTRPDLSSNRQVRLVRACRALMQDLKRHLLVKEVHMVTHSDYDEVTGDGLNKIEFASLPAIVLVGPRLVTPPGVYRDNRIRKTAPDAAGLVYERLPPRQRDLSFDVVIASETAMQTLNLVQEFERYIDSVLTLDIDGDPHELIQQASTETSGLGQANPDNIRQASSGLLIRNVYLDNEDGDAVRGVAPLQEAVQINSVQPASPLVLGSLPSGTIGQGTTANPVADPRQPTPEGISFEQLEDV